MSQQTFIEFSATLMSRTQKAVLCQFANLQELWLPLSQIQLTTFPAKPGHLLVGLPQWLIDKNHLTATPLRSTSPPESNRMPPPPPTPDTDTNLPKEQLLLKLLKMTTSSVDGEALTAIRKANDLLRSSGWDWDKLIASKIRIAANPFANLQQPPARESSRYEPSAPARPQPQQPQPPTSTPPKPNYQSTPHPKHYQSTASTPPKPKPTPTPPPPPQPKKPPDPLARVRPKQAPDLGQL